MIIWVPYPVETIKIPEEILPNIEENEHDYAKNSIHNPQNSLIEKLIEEKKYTELYYKNKCSLWEKKVRKLEKSVQKLENCVNTWKTKHDSLEKSSQMWETRSKNWKSKYKTLEATNYYTKISIIRDIFTND